MKKISIIAAVSTALLGAGLTGCSNDTIPATPSGGEVQFATNLSGGTRAYDNMWEPGDGIGVYMLKAGSLNNWNAATLLGKTNAHYGHNSLTDAAGLVFSGVDDANKLYWPTDGSAVDFVAYYPHTEAISADYLYSVDVSEQDPSKNDIDLLWTNTAKNQSSGSPALQFTHKMAKLVINVTDGSGADITDLTATIKGLNTTAKFDLRNGTLGSESDIADITPFDITPANADTDKRSFQAILIPVQNNVRFTVSFASASGGWSADYNVAGSIAGDHYLRPSRVYTYNLTLVGGTVIPDDSIVFGAEGSECTITDWIAGLTEASSEDDVIEDDVEKIPEQASGPTDFEVKWSFVGRSAWGTTPIAPVSVSPEGTVAVGNLTSTGFESTNTAPANSWGGSAGSLFSSNTPTYAAAYAQFTMSVAEGEILNLTSISGNAGLSASGPEMVQFRYSLNGTTFNDIETVGPLTNTVATVGNTIGIDLSSVEALQDIGGETTITIRMVPLKGSRLGIGQWFLLDSGSTPLTVRGTIE